MKGKCKSCGKNCEGEYCFRHKPRKRLPVSTKKQTNIKWQDRAAFFLMIWRNKPHKSEISGVHLGKEPLTIFFHHILPKEKYPQAEYDENNIILLTFDEHNNVEMDMYKYEEVNIRRKKLLEIYSK